MWVFFAVYLAAAWACLWQWGSPHPASRIDLFSGAFSALAPLVFRENEPPNSFEIRLVLLPVESTDWGYEGQVMGATVNKPKSRNSVPPSMPFSECPSNCGPSF